jgi:alanine dehydrogenase
VLVPGARTPILVNREMIKGMRPRSVIIDLSIDQGGCIETSRPTTHSNPTYMEEDIIHYCIPNMTGVLGRTATHTLGNASWPFVKLIAELGVEKALEASKPLKSGLYTSQGKIIHPYLHHILEGRR